MSFTNSNTYRAIKATGFIGLMVWVLTVASFFISFGFGSFSKAWMQVGWLVPLGFLVFGLFIFACFFDFCLYVAYKENMRNEQNISLGILTSLDRYLNNNIIAFLCIICFIITAIPALCYILPMAPIVLAVCYLSGLIKNRNNDKTE